MRDALDDLIAVLKETLQRNNIASTDLAALATVGGGARIPFVSQRLSEAMGMPLVTTSQPHVIAALGAARIGQRRPEDEAGSVLVQATDDIAPGPHPQSGLSSTRGTSARLQ